MQSHPGSAASQANGVRSTSTRTSLSTLMTYGRKRAMSKAYFHTAAASWRAKPSSSAPPISLTERRSNSGNLQTSSHDVQR